MKAKINQHGVVAEDGRSFELLGGGARYGFDSAYAVRESGEVAASPLPAHSLPWPFGDNDIEIEIDPELAAERAAEAGVHS